MVNKYYRKNFKEGTGPAARLGPTARKITKEIAKGITGAVSNKELKFIDSLKAAAKPKKKFKSPMQRQRKLDTLKSEAAKRGSIVMSGEEMQKLKGESDKSFKQRMDKAFKAKKGGRAALRMGTKKNFNKEERDIQKKVDRDALIFGAKKAIKNAKQKEAIKSGDPTKTRKVFDTRANALVFATANQIMNNPNRFKPVESKDVDPVGITKMLKASDKAKARKRAEDYMKMKAKEPGGRFTEKDIQMATGMKKGGRAALKKGSKFPDLTGDGKVTKADILKGRGVFSKGSKPKNIKDLTKARLGQFTIAGSLNRTRKLLKKKFGGGSK